jgi:hypothetical protein
VLFYTNQILEKYFDSKDASTTESTSKDVYSGLHDILGTHLSMIRNIVIIKHCCYCE